MRSTARHAQRIGFVAPACLAAALLAACTQPSGQEFGESRPYVDVDADVGPDEPVDIRDDLRLLPGDDGRIPVRVRWHLRVEACESLAYDADRQVVYLTHETLDAVHLHDGSVKWATTADEHGWWSDGGDRIGTTAAGHIRGFSPWNRDWIIDPATGVVLEDRGLPGRDWPRDFTPLPTDPPEGFTVTTRLDVPRMEAHAPDGRLLWELDYGAALYDECGPVAVEGGLVLGTPAGHVVALDL